MMKTYTETFTLLSRDCDVKGTWRLSAILEAMQESAGAHSLLLGCGREELLKRNIVWVLSRSELHMDRYPRIGEKITLHTFPMPNRICFFPRSLPESRYRIRWRNDTNTIRSAISS